MENNNFTTSISVVKSAYEVFNAINNPRAWWTEDIEGESEKVNDIFVHRYKGIHITKLQVVELLPYTKIVWLVLENYFSFTKDKTEWMNTKVVFDIIEQGEMTQLIFTHEGLVPQYECYEKCENAWTNFVQSSLRDLIETGVGRPTIL